MTPEHYDEFLNKCVDTSLPEYAILKTGVVLHRGVGGAERRLIAILCEVHEARKLLVLARTLHSPAAADIRLALDIAREL